MLLILPFILFCYVNCDDSEVVYYDSYKGTPITKEQLSEHIKHNTTFWCVNEIKPCKADEGSRVDGSCNNLKYPSRGASHTPFYRVLPAAYDKDFEVRKACSGNQLPLARLLGTRLLRQGRVPSQVFTQLTTYILLLLVTDVLSVHDTVNYVRWRPYCCMPQGKTDPMCAPNKVSPLDPVLRYSDVRCMTMTKPMTFQTTGCLANNTVPERIISSTSSFDMSTIYGSSSAAILKARLLRGGLLKYDLLKERVWPPAMDPKQASETCLLNQEPAETRCHNTPVPDTNSLLSLSVVTVWFWRMHNYIANQLAKINPCWTDEKLFKTARYINIAILMQVNLYELLSQLMGKENLVRSGVTVRTPGFRDIYDASLYPKVSLEFPFVMRWAHTIVSDFVDLHDNKGYYLKRISAVNMTTRTGYLAIDNNLEYITHGTFRQGCGKIDHTVDPDIANRGLGPVFKAFDVTTNDLAKDRQFGFQPYIKYREYCRKGSCINDCDDLANDIDAENIEIIKDVYENCKDLDLLAGIWLEKPVPGGYVPRTLYCIVVEQLLRAIRSDRHWYERYTRPDAFTFPQMLQIRKSTMAMILCYVGDNVTHIQQHAFLRPNNWNRIRSCKHIKKIDFSAWKDYRCDNVWRCKVDDTSI